MRISQAFLLLFMVIGVLSQPQLRTTELNADWTLNVIDGAAQASSLKDKTYQTSIPTVLHLDLLAAGDIPDPFVGDHYPKVKWVSDLNVKYATKFTVSADVFNYQQQDLVFEGIDTYAEVKLNGAKILTTENAFRKYEVAIKKYLKQGENVLEVFINSTNEFDNKGQQSNPMPFVYAHTRKACYQYSWDWAPFLNTMGIWQPVYLRSYTEVTVDYVWVRTRMVSQERATVNFAIALKEVPSAGLEGEYRYVVEMASGKEIANFPAKEKYSYYDVHIPEPQLWWPNGIGEPYIYDFVVKLMKGDALVEQKKIPFGIRTVELDLKDKGFTVKVNGYPVYCKGANYVPLDMFYPRLSGGKWKGGNTIEDLLADAQNSNFNMIRVWGGGQYESDKFLELASRKGIMVFYDFMFSDSIYPSTEPFLLNVEEEIKQQIRRARNYPCLAVWSGNNQILQGINDWGWGSGKYREDYRKLFEVLIPKIVEYESPYITYIPSSPVYGVGNYGIERGGDAHYWSVWAGGADFESYEKNVAKFNSEFGTQALPLWETITEAIENGTSYESKVLELHERHNSRFGVLRKYMNKYMKKPLNFEMETYQSGLLQAFAIGLAIKAQRVAKPKSWGTLYWQMNDAWPGISWSSIDYFGRWKPLQFMARRYFPDVAVFYLSDRIHVVNDKLYDINALVIIKFFSLKGELLKKEEKSTNVKGNQVLQVYKLQGDECGSTDRNQCMIYMQVVAGKDRHMTSTHFHTYFKDLNLPEAQISVEYHPEFNEITIQSTGPVVKNLFISHSSTYAKFSDNYFDLVPGHPVKVVLLHKDGLAKLKDGLRYRSYRQVYEAGSQVRVQVK